MQSIVAALYKAQPIGAELRTKVQARLNDHDDQPNPGSLVCSECGRAPDPGENADDEWRVESEGLGGRHTFCPECWQREFGVAAESDSHPSAR
jgi:hypothetical protein